MAPAVARISTTPVRGFALGQPRADDLAANGVVEDRRFLLCDGDGNRLRSSLTSWPVVLRGVYEADRESLSVVLPDGTKLSGSARGTGRPVRVEIGLRGQIDGHVVEGPWNDALSRIAGHPVVVVRTARPGDAHGWPVTLVSTASLRRLERAAGTQVDPRRFRMLFTVRRL